MVPSVYLCVCACVCVYPADVLALWTRRKRLGANDGVSPDKRVLMVQLETALFGPHHGGGLREVLHARLFIHLWQSQRTLNTRLRIKQPLFMQKLVINQSQSETITVGK